MEPVCPAQGRGFTTGQDALGRALGYGQEQVSYELRDGDAPRLAAGASIRAGAKLGCLH